jgi:carbonic anhydrase
VQVSNIEASSTVVKARASGKDITVDGWVYDGLGSSHLTSYVPAR